MCIYREKTWSLQFSKISYSEHRLMYICVRGQHAWLKIHE